MRNDSILISMAALFLAVLAYLYISRSSNSSAIAAHFIVGPISSRPPNNGKLATVLAEEEQQRIRFTPHLHEYPSCVLMNTNRPGGLYQLFLDDSLTQYDVINFPHTASAQIADCFGERLEGSLRNKKYAKQFRHSLKIVLKSRINKEIHEEQQEEFFKKLYEVRVTSGDVIDPIPNSGHVKLVLAKPVGRPHVTVIIFDPKFDYGEKHFHKIAGFLFNAVKEALQLPNNQRRLGL